MMQGGWRVVGGAAVAVLLLVTLQLLGRWIPPLQSPDELSHLIRVASMAEGEVLAITEPGVSTGGKFDLALAALAKAHVPVITERDPRVPVEDIELARSQRWLGQQIYGEAPGSAIYLPVIYAPATLGLAIGQTLGWTVMDSYHLARLTSQLFCVAVLLWAIWLWPPPLLACALLLLPMSLFQMVAPVVDGPAHALTLLAMSMLMRLRQAPTRAWAWGTAACLVVLVTARMHLLPLLLVPLWWAWRRPWEVSGTVTGSRVNLAQPLAWAGAAAITATLAWAVWAASSVVDTRVQRTVGNGAVALHYLLHPQDLWDVFARTFTDEHRPQFLTDSFIGNIGWLDTRMPEAAYPTLWWGLAAMMVLGLPWWGQRRGTGLDRIALALCALGSSFLVFMLMLITWSPFPTDLIEGVQGRYFIAPAIVAAYAFAPWPLPSGGLTRAAGMRQARGGRAQGASGEPRFARAVWLVAIGVFSVISLSFLAETLLARYPAWARGGLFG